MKLPENYYSSLLLTVALQRYPKVICVKTLMYNANYYLLHRAAIIVRQNIKECKL